MYYKACKQLFPYLILVQLGGCASTARYPDNPPLERFDSETTITHMESQGSGNVLLILTFSGGGSRAAALAYGVLEALAATPLATDRGMQSMLEEVDMISSVSGGSVTAAYYGLYGDRLFRDFRSRFLERDVSSELTNKMLTPGTLSRLSSETFGSGDVLDEYFRDELFGTDAVRKLVDEDGPFVQINATDLFKGGQFAFTPEQFALICSDIDRFPVSRAVAASSAVPLVFAPITLTNRAGSCDYTPPLWLQQGLQERGSNNRRYRIASYLNVYLDQQGHPYIHLVDGGLSDNLGLHAVMDYIVINGGLWYTLQRLNLQDAQHIALIAVDASALLPSQWEQSDTTPSSFAILDAATTTPLANYNFETLEFLRSNLPVWRDELKQHRCAGRGRCATPGIYLIELRLDDIADPERKKRLTSIPTDFSLAPDVVDELIDAAQQLLDQNAQYRRLLKAIQPASR